MKLKLSSRERILLTLLGICVIAAILYYAAIKPQMDYLGQLEEKAAGYMNTIDSLKAKADPNNPLYQEYEQLNDETKQALRRFYPSIIQEKLILLLNEKLSVTGLKMNGISFGEIEKTDLLAKDLNQNTAPVQSGELQELVEQLGGKPQTSTGNQTNAAAETTQSLSLDKMTAAINVEGTYEQIYGFIKQIELENRSIVCSQLEISEQGTSQLIATVVLNFYAVPKPFEMDQEYLNWDLEGTYNKTNPFSPLSK